MMISRDEMIRMASRVSELGLEEEARSMRIVIDYIDRLQSWLDVIAEEARKGESFQRILLLAEDAKREH